MSRSGSSTPILFLHGAWRGSWCWAEVLARVTGAGARALAVDMAGHGLRARQPAALTSRPFDASLLAREPSPVADGSGCVRRSTVTSTARWRMRPSRY